MGREAGCRDALLGFITALKRASSSVCESPRTCTICCPAGGAPWCASMSPKFDVATNLSSITQTGFRINTGRFKSRWALELWTDLFTVCAPPPPSLPHPFELLCPCVSVSNRNISGFTVKTKLTIVNKIRLSTIKRSSVKINVSIVPHVTCLPHTFKQTDRFPPLSFSVFLQGKEETEKSQPGKRNKTKHAGRHWSPVQTLKKKKSGLKTDTRERTLRKGISARLPNFFTSTAQSRFMW